MAKKRSIKVISQSGHNYKATPTIMLKGQRLKELGFDIGDYVSVTCHLMDSLKTFLYCYGKK